MFYKQILDKEYPKLSSREKAKYAGKIWGFLPNNFKNSFIAYANRERLLNEYVSPRPNIVQHSIENSQPESGLRIIFDDHCHKDVLLNESSNEIPSDESDHYDKIFDQYINEDAYI